MGSKLIVLLVVVLGVIAIAQLVRLYELSSKLRKRKEHEISLRDNLLNAKLMIVFMIIYLGGMVYLLVKYGWTGRGVAASDMGEDLDWLMDINMLIVFIVFFVFNFVIFYFSYKYVARPGKKAFYFPHSAKLEMIWTFVPSATLVLMIILGLNQWYKVTGPASEDAIVIEVYSKQFDWTVRYSGQDNTLGLDNYKATTDKNILGIVNTETLDYAIDKIKNDTLLGIDALEKTLHNKSLVFSSEEREQLETDLHNKEQIYRLLVQRRNRHDQKLDAQSWDDIIVRGPAEKMYLCVDQEYEIKLRSKDVIHSAHFPNFRQQMNTVPGQITRVKFTPTITTAEMREMKNDPKFDFSLLCNKICGSSHYKMYMLIEVLEKDEYSAVMKALEYGADNAARPADKQLTAKELKLITNVFGTTLPGAHRFDVTFKGAPAPANDEAIETEVASDSTAMVAQK